VIQADLLLKRSGHIVMVELDTEPALASSSETALRGLFASWRWS
jgi:hypothetical protein